VPLSYLVNPEIEAGALAALRKAVGWDARKDKMEKIIGCTYLTAACYDHDQLVGFVDVLSDGVDDALVRSLVVDPQYQRKGIGLELLRIVTAKVKKDQIKTVNVLFEPELSAFYKKAGFRIVSGGLIDNEEG
jgi:N-acetylglutamate synthase-like GNAT family acetyltransferase